MLNKQKEKGIKYNIENSFLKKTEMEYLDLWVTHDGVKPINKRLETLTNMKPTTS